MRHGRAPGSVDEEACRRLAALAVTRPQTYSSLLPALV